MEPYYEQDGITIYHGDCRDVLADIADSSVDPGKHPCEKPLAMIEHIIESSSRDGAVVLDCFAGSGVVGEAARNFGREAWLCEIEDKWCRRIKQQLQQRVMFAAAAFA